MAERKVRTNFLKFLGTSGARFVMIKQKRHSGGLWMSYKGTNILVDPGPGSLVRCLQSKPAMDPSILDGIVLTHKHLDHSNDVNVMIEAMTEGGRNKKGIVFCPEDALNNEPVILTYVRNFPQEIKILRQNSQYQVGNIKFETSMRHMHLVETYGIKIELENKSLGILTDTRFFEGLKDFYNVDILVLSVVFFDKRPDIDHIGFQDVRTLLGLIKPKKVYLTHFGLTMLANNPEKLAKELSKEFKIQVVAAKDGLEIDLN